MGAANIRQHSADYAAPRLIRASRHEREPSLEKILLIQFKYACFYYPVWLFESRSVRLCNSYYLFVVVLFRHVLENRVYAQQGKSEEFDSYDRPSNLTQIGFKSSIFQPVWPWNLIDDPEK